MKKKLEKELKARFGGTAVPHPASDDAGQRRFWTVYDAVEQKTKRQVTVFTVDDAVCEEGHAADKSLAWSWWTGARQAADLWTGKLSHRNHLRATDSVVDEKEKLVLLVFPRLTPLRGAAAAMCASELFLCLKDVAEGLSYLHDCFQLSHNALGWDSLYLVDDFPRERKLGTALTTGRRRVVIGDVQFAWGMDESLDQVLLRSRAYRPQPYHPEEDPDEGESYVLTHKACSIWTRDAFSLGTLVHDVLGSSGDAGGKVHGRSRGQASKAELMLSGLLHAVREWCNGALNGAVQLNDGNASSADFDSSAGNMQPAARGFITEHNRNHARPPVRPKITSFLNLEVFDRCVLVHVSSFVDEIFDGAFNAAPNAGAAARQLRAARCEAQFAQLKNRLLDLPYDAARAVLFASFLHPSFWTAPGSSLFTPYLIGWAEGGEGGVDNGRGLDHSVNLLSASVGSAAPPVGVRLQAAGSTGTIGDEGGVGVVSIAERPDRDSILEFVVNLLGGRRRPPRTAKDVAAKVPAKPTPASPKDLALLPLKISVLRIAEHLLKGIPADVGAHTILEEAARLLEVADSFLSIPGSSAKTFALPFKDSAASAIKNAAQDLDHTLALWADGVYWAVHGALAASKHFFIALDMPEDSPSTLGMLALLNHRIVPQLVKYANGLRYPGKVRSSALLGMVDLLPMHPGIQVTQLLPAVAASLLSDDELLVHHALNSVILAENALPYSVIALDVLPLVATVLLSPNPKLREKCQRVAHSLLAAVEELDADTDDADLQAATQLFTSPPLVKGCALATVPEISREDKKFQKGLSKKIQDCEAASQEDRLKNCQSIGASEARSASYQRPDLYGAVDAHESSQAGDSSADEAALSQRTALPPQHDGIFIDVACNEACCLRLSDGGPRDLTTVAEKTGLSEGKVRLEFEESSALMNTSVRKKKKGRKRGLSTNQQPAAAPEAEEHLSDPEEAVEWSAQWGESSQFDFLNNINNDNSNNAANNNNSNSNSTNNNDDDVAGKAAELEVEGDPGGGGPGKKGKKKKKKKSGAPLPPQQEAPSLVSTADVDTSNTDQPAAAAAAADERRGSMNAFEPGGSSFEQQSSRPGSPGSTISSYNPAVVTELALPGPAGVARGGRKKKKKSSTACSLVQTPLDPALEDSPAPGFASRQSSPRSSLPAAKPAGGLFDLATRLDSLQISETQPDAAAPEASPPTKRKGKKRSKASAVEPEAPRAEAEQLAEPAAAQAVPYEAEMSDPAESSVPGGLRAYSIDDLLDMYGNDANNGGSHGAEAEGAGNGAPATPSAKAGKKRKAKKKSSVPGLLPPTHG
ncbi:putative inactive serine/threonine-protein kinase scy1 [Diplonema papillatum]|nr:putative inactive serine/threonine-protein kinase scy1 [Diplonema papillatum]